MGVNVAHATGLEARFAAQVAHASEGLSLEEADGLVKILVSKYADGQDALPIGKPFTEAYDLETIQPTLEWQQIYEEVCEEIETEFRLTLES